jgi:hypothetical protein
MVPLLDLAMRHITDVLSPDCASVMSAQDLKPKFGSRRVKTKHINALYKLAYLLNEAEPQGICTDKSRLRREVIEANGVRRIASVHVQALRAAPYEHQLNALKTVIAPARCSKPGHTILEALARMGEAQLNGVQADTIKLDLTCRPQKWSPSFCTAGAPLHFAQLVLPWCSRGVVLARGGGRGRHPRRA